MKHLLLKRVYVAVTLISFFMASCATTKPPRLIQIPMDRMPLTGVDENKQWINGNEFILRQNNDVAVAVSFNRHIRELYQDYVVFYVEVTNLSDSALMIDPGTFYYETEPGLTYHGEDPQEHVSKINGYLAGTPLPKPEKDKEGLSTGQKVLIGIFFIVVAVALLAVLASGSDDDDDNGNKKETSVARKKTSNEEKKAKGKKLASGKEDADDDEKDKKVKSRPDDTEKSKTTGKGKTGGGHDRDDYDDDGFAGFFFSFQSWGHDEEVVEVDQAATPPTKKEQLLAIKDKWESETIRRQLLEPGDTIRGNVIFIGGPELTSVDLTILAGNIEETFKFYAGGEAHQ